MKVACRICFDVGAIPGSLCGCDAGALLKEKIKACDVLLEQTTPWCPLCMDIGVVVMPAPIAGTERIYCDCGAKWEPMAEHERNDLAPLRTWESFAAEVREFLIYDAERKANAVKALMLRNDPLLEEVTDLVNGLKR